MEHVIVSGCSFTDKDFFSQQNPEYNCDYKKWPEYIDVDCHITNVAKSGFGNTQIVQSALTEIASTDNVDRVVIALSDWFRFGTPQNNCGRLLGTTINPYLADSHKKNLDKNIIELRNAHTVIKEKSLELCNYLDIDIENHNVCRYTAHQTLLNIWILHEICKSKNIKLHVFQLHNCEWNKFSMQRLAKEILQNPIFKKLDDISNIDLIGWPFVESLGGICVENKLLPKFDSRYRISAKDAHPNEYGHKVIGEWFNENAKI
jgi:hypothetical protein